MFQKSPLYAIVISFANRLRESLVSFLGQKQRAFTVSRNVQFVFH